MAKKSRRVRKKGRKVRLSETQLARPGAEKTADASLASKTVESAAEIVEEYRYVATDLKRVAIIAGGLLLVAVILAVVLL